MALCGTRTTLSKAEYEALVVNTATRNSGSMFESCLRRPAGGAPFAVKTGPSAAEKVEADLVVRAEQAPHAAPVAVGRWLVPGVRHAGHVDRHAAAGHHGHGLEFIENAPEKIFVKIDLARVSRNKVDQEALFRGPAARFGGPPPADGDGAPARGREPCDGGGWRHGNRKSCA